MKLGAVLAALSVTNILLQFAQLWFVITRLGPGIETDSLYSGMVIPQLVLAVVSGSLMHVLVPLLTTADEAEFHRNVWGLLSAVGAVFASSALLLAISAQWWVPLLVPGFSREAKALTISLTHIQLTGMVFTAVVSVLWAAYHAKRKFILAESSPVLANAVAFAFLYWALPRYGVSGAAWSTVLAAVLQVGFLLPAMGVPCFPDWRSATIAEALRRLKPLWLGTIYYKTDPAVDRFLASMAQPGALSLLYVGQQFYSAANQVINKAIVAPMVPSLAFHAGKEDWKMFGRIYHQRLAVVLGCTVTGFLLFIVLGKTFLSHLIGYGGVTSQSIHTLWWIIVMLVGVLIGGGVGQIISSAFYATGDTRTPTRIGVAGFTAGMVLKVLGFWLWGVLGIALGTTLYYFLNAGLLARSMEKRLQDSHAA